ncbi:hypothetical protein F5984_10490 [Rudanella paleaurantiibacter]|uniref:Uncharacterized protein n=1 Tax=Rudanella paleaurantiibacter TaxID=2614655 RepID=A0A7J5U0E4_9BACT|nr:hypothetical protein [Rudanella paleaurantiibacter]KAB7731222.1 hypothetical protein F5984_10490 [Rudanella paleaurantiibacter]
MPNNANPDLNRPQPPTGLTPFVLDPIPGTRTLLHRVDLPTYERFRQTTNPEPFFRDLSEQLRAEGWLVVHLWADVEQLKPAVVASRVRALAGDSVRIPARLTQVRRIDRPTALAFLEQNHLQVATASKYKYGLWLPQRYFRVLPPDYLTPEQAQQPECLVAVATFSHPRTIPRDGQPYRSYELVRFANRLGCTVVGGLDKLLKAFVAEHKPDDIMTYADRDWSDGRSYERLGFERLGETDPQLFWLDPITLQRHYPHRIDDTTGLIPVWNAGSIKFVKKLKPESTESGTS